MVYELGHLDDRYNNNNNICVGDPLHKKRRLCGSNNVNKFIGNFAKNYMETTEGENWASNLISHFNNRFPTSIDTSKNFIQQEVQDANLHQIISSHSSLPDLLVSNSFFPPQNDMTLGYGHYSSASLNIYNPILCGGSAYNEYIQNVAYDGVNLISPLGVQESDLDIITSPEQVSTITACSYGDVISDTEAFDCITPNSSFQQQPFHNIGQYRNFAGNNRSAYNMDHPLLSVDDVQSPYTNSCNVQQSFQNLPEACYNLQNKCNNQDSFQPQIQGQQHFGLESSSDVYDFKVLSDYVMYKCMPANVRKGVSFQNYMHATECRENLCKCHLHLELSSHFDKCKYVDCNICGPARSLCGSTASFLLESRKRKFDQSDVTDNMGHISTGTLLDALPTKYPKLESLTVREDAVDDEQRRKVNGSHDQQESTVVDQSDNFVNNEMMKYSKFESSTVGEDTMDDDQRRKVNGSHDQQISTLLNQSDDITNNEMMRYPKSENSTVRENAMDDNQRREVSGAHDQHELIAVHQSDNIASNEMMKHSKLESSTVGEAAMDDEQRGVVNGAPDQQESTVVNKSDNIANNEMMNYPVLESSTVGEDAMDNDQRMVVDGAHDQHELKVVDQSDDVADNEMVKCRKLESSIVGEDSTDDDQRMEVNGAHDQHELKVIDQSDDIANNEMVKYRKLDISTVGEDATDDDQRSKVNGAHDQQETTVVVNQTDNIANNETMKYPKLDSSTVGEDVLDEDQRREVNGANYQQEVTAVNQSDTIVNNQMTKYSKLDTAVGEDVMADDQRREVNGANDQQELTVVNQSDNIVNTEMLKSPHLCSDNLSSKEMTTDEKEKSGQAIIEASDDLNSGADVANFISTKSLTPDVSMVDCDSTLGSDHTKIKITSSTDSGMMKSTQLCFDDLSSKEMTIGEKKKPDQAITEASDALNSGADVAGLISSKSFTPDVSMVDCDSALGSDHTKIKIASLTDNEMMKSPHLCSDDLSSKEMIVDEKGKSGLAKIEASDDLNTGVDVADLNLIKSMTPNVSMVDCGSALGSDHAKIKIATLNDKEMMKSLQLCSDHISSEEMTIDEKEKSGQAIIEASNGLSSGADVADLMSNKSLTPNVSMVDCDSVLEQENTDTKITSLTDNDSPLEPEKIKIQSVSLADFFTADQIKEHLLSFTSQKVCTSENRAPSIGPNTCQLCSMDKLVFAPAPIYCSSCDTRIKRNVGYYRSTNVIGTRHCFCMSCYRGSHGNYILLRGYGYSIPKSNLQKARNDEEKEDSWVLCDKCQCWQHRICGLYNDEKDVEGKAEYICPKCYLEEMESGIRVPLPQTTASGAKDLPRTNLSDHIEERLSKRLDQERQEMAKISGIEPNEVPGAEGLVVRVVVSVEKQLEVRQKFINILHGEDYPSGFTYRSKLIFLFQKIEGVDVCLFGMCVQEFGSECGGPNQRCVYISYLDSVKYFRPERKCVSGESLRTFVYHEILTGYLEYCKKRGFATCYIWACPLIKGEDYIFYCHPETQRTPKQDKLRQWYKSMLKKATEDNIVVDHTNLYNQFFVPGGEGNMKITAARLPYFDGDYWSGAAENIVRKLEVEESAGGLQSKLPNKRILKAMGQDKTDIAVKDVLVMQKLGQTILPVKENFMIVHLQYICTHCHEVILSGSRWFCSHCKKFQLCSRCFNADKNISGSKLHTCHSGERNQLSEVVVNDVTLDTKDTDDVVVNSFFETRDAFLNKCQKSHFQFDTLSRAKYSSMMILYHLIYKPVIKPTCSACHADVMVELCWRCDTCTKYNICESCYKMRHGAYHPHSLNPPSMDIECRSKSELLQLQKDWPLRFVLDTLMHASECDRIPCAYKECNTMRRLFYHAVRCSVKARGGCKYCQRVWMILKLHSQICTDSDCKIPRCMDIKKHKEMLAARLADQQVTMNDQQEVAAVVPVG